MDWSIREIMRRLRVWSWWKKLWLDILIAVLTVSVITIPIFALGPIAPIALTTTLLADLFTVLFLTHKGKIRAAILAAFVACLAFDFFLIPPTFSLTFNNIEQGIDLLLFLLLAIMLIYIYGQQKRRNSLELTRYEERLRMQSEEANRRAYDFRTFYDVMEVSRDQKDLKLQLSQLAQAIANAFVYCGIRGCSFYLPDLDSQGNTSMWILASQKGSFPDMAAGDERSVMWMMQHGKSLILPEIPLVSRAKGNYLRRVVVSNTKVDQCGYCYNYLVPLLSSQKVIAVMRLYVEDDGNAELSAIKAFLEQKEHPPAGTHAELFSKLYKHTVSIIEQTLIERALLREESLRQELQKRTEEMHTSIISSVSHDFRTPLTQIMGAAGGLLNRSRPDEDEVAWGDSLRTIVSETERLERIVAKMLALSRIEHGAFALKRELYPIDMIILNVLDQGHMRSLKQGRHIEIIVPDDVPPVELDPDFIGQVFTNLIENAIRYTPASSPIEISARADDEQVSIAVADRGRGIPPDELEQVFERFHRVKQGVLGDAVPGPGQGSGLGLAVCRGFVHAHGGLIRAENRKHGGAKFIFTLPLHVAEE